MNRLAENADDLYRAFRDLSIKGVVTKTQGICYPVARVIPESVFFYFDVTGKLRGCHNGEITYFFPSLEQEKYFNDAIDKDQVEILVLTRSGYLSSWKERVILEVLHSPKGNSFHAYL